MRPRVFISGASGFIGRACCARLVQSGFGVRAGLRKYCQLAEGVEPAIVGDLSGATQFSDALRGVDVIVHLASRVHMLRDTARDKLQAFRLVNVEGTLTLARQAALAGVKRFVFISSIGVNGTQTFASPFGPDDAPRPNSPYARSKFEAETGLRKIADQSSLEVVIIRPPLVYGPGAPGNFGVLIRLLQRGWPLPFGSVRNKRSYVFLDNLVDLIATCVVHSQAANETFLVSDGDDLSTPELMLRLGRFMDRPAKLVPVPPVLLRSGARILGRPEIYSRLCGSLQVDISKTISLLQWTPPISVNEGLRRASRRL
ncbi:NAD-dependent epimerase/dehydratase family protein [Desulfovibrio aerotolerans]|uniref:NAD-dependent epimerase/dehydratase family protein n=1 Tax=Solidesulfovibrio aerotolerans TaxID=295255 RepID=A0A7C9IVE5_9BACT|nr:SDR family oxidoreductase [Solidesulfovibrio aerotolerans]MYL82542.1 NAD-dependent epimerase/dehydratase family protein [Solidesulfovibrio aerotolerans]